MAIIDSDNFIAHLIWSGLIDKATCGELKEAIELCTVKDIYTKADLVTILTEIQSEILELKSYESADGQDLVMLADIGTLFQQKIDKLKEREKDETGKSNK